MASDVEAGVRRQIERLRKELDAANERNCRVAGAEAGAARRDDRLERGFRGSGRPVHSGYHERRQDGGREILGVPQAGDRSVVKGESSQAHWPGHVREDLTSKGTRQMDETQPIRLEDGT